VALEQTVEACLDLAWTAFCNNIVPVGAILLDETGRVVATGRSRMYETSAPPPEIANSSLAHAEVNALIGLDPEYRYESHHLVTTLEPCPLCIGVVMMATIGHLTFLGGDPYAGATGVLGATPHTSRVPLEVVGPRSDAIGRLASASMWRSTCTATHLVKSSPCIANCAQSWYPWPTG
jgi:tRNA(adenine34) deaminase